MTTNEGIRADIMRVLAHGPLMPGQMTLLKALYEARDEGLSRSKLTQRILTWQGADDTADRGQSSSLRGVLGGLGSRINRAMEDTATPGTALFLESWKAGGETYYRMRPELRNVIESLPKLRAALSLSPDDIQRQYRNGLDVG